VIADLTAQAGHLTTQVDQLTLLTGRMQQELPVLGDSCEATLAV
jgi:hypothetical protein